MEEIFCLITQILHFAAARNSPQSDGFRGALILLILLFFGKTAVFSQQPMFNAQNKVTWTCGSSFTDARDSKSYNTVLIGSQCWMAENLNIGTSVTGATAQTNNATIEKYCYADNAANCTTYGGLYQWAEMVQYTNGATNTTSPSPPLPANLQGICPSGWHLPTDAEWCTMENTVEAGTDAGCSILGWRGTNTGAKLKTTTGWFTNNGTNTSGFSALPGGYRNTDGSFLSVDYYGYWWPALESSATAARYRNLIYTEARVLRDNINKALGFSCRCVKD